MIYIASNVVGHCNPSRAQTWTGRVPLRKSDLPVPLPANAHLRLVAPPRSTDAPTEPLPALRVLGHEPNHAAKNRRMRDAATLPQTAWATRYARGCTTTLDTGHSLFLPAP